jgi:hypothetical protein
VPVCIFGTCRDSIVRKDAPKENLGRRVVIYSMTRSELKCDVFETVRQNGKGGV